MDILQASGDQMEARRWRGSRPAWTIAGFFGAAIVVGVIAFRQRAPVATIEPGVPYFNLQVAARGGELLIVHPVKPYADDNSCRFQIEAWSLPECRRRKETELVRSLRSAAPFALNEKNWIVRDHEGLKCLHRDSLEEVFRLELPTAKVPPIEFPGRRTRYDFMTSPDGKWLVAKPQSFEFPPSNEIGSPLHGSEADEREMAPAGLESLLWNIEARTGPRQIPDIVQEMAFSGDSLQLIYSTGFGCKIVSLDNQNIAKLRWGEIDDIAVQERGNLLALVASDSQSRYVDVWDFEKREPLFTFTPHQGSTRQLCFAAQGDILITVGVGKHPQLIFDTVFPYVQMHHFDHHEIKAWDVKLQRCFWTVRLNRPVTWWNLISVPGADYFLIHDTSGTGEDKFELWYAR